jgi:uncharacterized protein (TIGR00730 family)
LNRTPGPLEVLSEEATSEAQLLTGRDSRTQELLRVARVSREFVRGFQALHFAPPCITFFGSARFGEASEHYAPARELATEVAKLGFAIMTGGGPGLMEAANRGARDVGGASYGATIDIGREPSNAYIDKRIPFHYFFARKVVLVKYSYGFVHLPGGFGTLDEMYEALTLMQTDRLGEFPVILYGTEYWGGMVDWIRDTLLPAGAIIQADVDRFLLTDDPAEVVAVLTPIANRLSLKSPDVSRMTPATRVSRARRFGRL